MLFLWDDKKLKDICILFGGVSPEHTVSIASARNVYKAMDKEKYKVTLVGISKEGKWYLQDPKIFENKDLHEVVANSDEVFFLPGSKGKLIRVSDNKQIIQIDVAFPVLHGNQGEDGSVQGLFKLVDMPYVGSNVLASAISLDKGISKKLLKENGIPTPNFLVFKDSERIDSNNVVYKLGLPFVVKPASLGSSVGVSIVSNKYEITTGINKAFKYDKKIVVEEYIQARELECSVLGNHKPQVSGIGEVIPNDEFYTYDCKYSKQSKTELVIPADIDMEKEKEIQRLALKVFKTLGCEGMARVDFFLKDDGTVLVGEVNTIPGFTDISMYPKLWEKSGVDNTQLVDKLLELAIDRYEREYPLERVI